MSQSIDNKLLADYSASIEDERMPFFVIMIIISFDKL